MPGSRRARSRSFRRRRGRRRCSPITSPRPASARRPLALARGRRARMARSAYREAIVHVRRGLEVASNVPGPEGERAGTRLHNLLGRALLAAHGPRPEVIEAYEEAERLAAEAGENGAVAGPVGLVVLQLPARRHSVSAVDRVRPAGPGRRDERRRLGAPGAPCRVDHRLAGWRLGRGARACRGWPAALR